MSMMYSKRERRIFRFFDGTRDRGIDPALVYRRLIAEAEFDIESDIKAIDSVNIASDDAAGAAARKAGLQAFARVVGQIRAAFGVKAFDDTNGQEMGLMDDECIALLQSFMDWMNELEKKTESSPTPLDSTASLTEGESVTGSGLGSGSIESGSLLAAVS